MDHAKLESKKTGKKMRQTEMAGKETGENPSLGEKVMRIIKKIKKIKKNKKMLAFY